MSSENNVDNVNVENEVEELKNRITTLEKALGEILAVIKATQSIQPAQSAQQPAQPTQPTQPGFDIVTLAPLLAEFFRPKTSKLEELILSKAIDSLLTSIDLNRQFMESLLSKLAESLGKKTGERIANILVVSE